MRLIAPLMAALVLGATPLLAGEPRYDEHPDYVANEGPPPASLYDRIIARYGHLGRDVKERFRDGPCEIERRWERDGDFEEHIECRGPRD